MTNPKPGKKKKAFDLFAESSDSEEEQNEEQDGAGADPIQAKGFTVHNPSVDEDGYYQPKTGEIVLGRYQVTSIAGKGVFSCVVKALDLEASASEQRKEVAIKIMRTKFEVMRQSGLKERDIVARLNQGDRYDKKHCIRLLDSFEYNQQLCLVYECMGRNLRETLSKFGRNIGLSLDGVILYGR